MKNIKIVITFFLLWLSIQVDYDAENAFAYLAIFTLGLLHGANDIKLLEKRLSLGEERIVRVLLGYIGFVLVVGGLFYFVPAFALSFFVLISGFHFGEEHWQEKLTVKRKGAPVFYTSYGLFILFLIFYLNPVETSAIVLTITTYDLPENFYFIGLLLLLVTTMLSFVIARIKLDTDTSIVEEIVYVGVLFVVFKMASLLLSFAIYFVVWHAIPSLKGQIAYLYGKTTKATVWMYMKSSFIYWLASIIGISIFYYFLGDQTYLFNAIFFAFLAAITFPHVWVINSLRKG